MDFLPLIFLLAGIWNLFLFGRNLRRGYTTAWFQRHQREAQPATFWVSNGLLGVAGLSLIAASFLVGSF